MGAPGTGVQGRRVVLCSAGTQVGGFAVDEVKASAFRVDEPLVRLATRVGSITSARQQRFRVRRSGRPGEPFGEPQWLAAHAVRPGDYVCRPAGKGQAEWFPVTEVAQVLASGPLYAVETEDDSIVVNGFLAQAQPSTGE